MSQVNVDDLTQISRYVPSSPLIEFLAAHIGKIYKIDVCAIRIFPQLMFRSPSTPHDLPPVALPPMSTRLRSIHGPSDDLRLPPHSQIPSPGTVQQSMLRHQRKATYI